MSSVQGHGGDTCFDIEDSFYSYGNIILGNAMIFVEKEDYICYHENECQMYIIVTQVEENYSIVVLN